MFSVDEANIKDENIKKYLEFYLSFEKMLEENQAKSEEMYQSLEEESKKISQLLNQKLKNIELIFQNDEIE